MLSDKLEPEEPEYPDGETTKKDEAIWSKKYNAYLREAKIYRTQKSKVFNVIVGQCDKAMRNRIEAMSEYESVESGCDIVALLRMIKDICFDANERKYPPMQAAMAWVNLCKIW